MTPLPSFRVLRRKLLFTALVALVCAVQPLFAESSVSKASTLKSAVASRLHATVASPTASAQARADDCQLRSFTLKYVNFLSQMPVTGDWTADAASAIQIDRCAGTPRADPELRRAAGEVQWSDSERERLERHGALPSAARPAGSSGCQWEVFVSPEGSDAQSGDMAAPLQSIARALALSRAVPRLTSSSGTSAVCITLRNGTYYLGYSANPASTSFDSRVGGLALTPADSGLTIAAYQGETAVLSGGVPLTVDWQLWRGRSYRASLNGSVIPALDRWHFNELYVDDRRGVRAKYPNGDPAVHGLWDKVGWLSGAKSWTPPRRSGRATEIHIQSPQRNGTHFPEYQIGIGGPASVFEPPQSFWASSGPPAGGKYEVPSGLTMDAVTAGRAKQWTNSETGTVFAFHSGHWGSWAFDIAGVNNATAEISFGRGGFQEARGSGSGAEYYVSHILEELDDDLEWFVDYDGGALYLQPANGTAPTTLVAAQLPCIVSIQGQPGNLARDISLVGLTFAHSANTYMRDYEVPSGGDWSVHRGGAVFLDNTADIFISTSKFVNLGGNAVVLSNLNLAPTIAFSEFVWLGESALVLLGSVSGIDGVTNAQQPTDAMLVGSLVHELGAHIKQTAGVAQFLSRRTQVSKCAMFNMPRAGININDGFAGGLNISGNVIFNTVRETSDHGPFNSWDRQPYLVDYGTGPTLVPERSYITANLLFNCYTSTWPIDHDDGSAYYTDSYNVLVYGGYKSYLAHSKTAHNQLYIYPDGQRFDAGAGGAEMDGGAMAEKYGAAAKRPGAPVPAIWGANCAQYFSQQPGDSGWDEYFFNNTCVMQSTGEILGFPFGGCDATTPSFQSAMPHTANNTFLLPPGAQFWLSCDQRGTNHNFTLDEWQKSGFDAGSVQTKAPGLTAVLMMAANMLGFERL